MFFSVDGYIEFFCQKSEEFFCVCKLGVNYSTKWVVKPENKQLGVFIGMLLSILSNASHSVDNVTCFLSTNKI